MTSTTGRSGWRDTLTVAAVCFAWLAATAWMRPLLAPDEGRYATVAWEMLRSGDWLTPTLNGLPFFHKPPLFYWLTGAALSVVGVTEIAARFASLAGATLGALSLYLFTRHWCGQGLARRMLWVLLVQPLFFVGGQFANLDMLVAGCITATVLALAHAALSFEHGMPYRRALLLAYGLAALGVLSKGLIGFVIPCMVVGLWLLVRWRWRTVWALLSLPGLALFLLVTVPWFAAMQQRFDGFMHYFFVVQHFQRFAAGGFNNVQPFWFYPLVLFVFSLPCILWARGVVVRSYFKVDATRGALRLLMVLMVGCVLLFFSLPQSKLLGYILPAVPPLAWLIADASAATGSSPEHSRWWWATLVCSAMLGLAVVVGLTVDQRRSTRSLGLALRQQHVAGQPVYMLKEYLYDVPFYARLREPVFVVDDWNDPAITQRDNWRKEIADAAAFNPQLAKRLLLTPEALPASLCSAGVGWVLGSENLRERHAFLAQAETLHVAYGQALWRIDPSQPAQAAALHCPKGPHG